MRREAYLSFSPLDFFTNIFKLIFLIFLYKNFPFPIDFTDILCYYVKALKQRALFCLKK